MTIRTLILLITLPVLAACSNDNDPATNTAVTNSAENSNPIMAGNDQLPQNDDINENTGSDTSADASADNGTVTGTDTAGTEAGTDTGNGSDTAGIDTGGVTDNGSDTAGIDTGGDTGNGSDTAGNDTGGDTGNGSDTAGNETGTDTGNGSDTAGNDTGSDTGNGSDTAGNDTGTDTGNGSDTAGNDTGGDTGSGSDTAGNDTGTTTDTDADGNSTDMTDADLMKMISTGPELSSATGYWRCGFQRPKSATLPINFQLFANGEGAMTASSTKDALFSTRDNSTAWMVVDGTLTVQAGGDFGPINMSMIDFANNNKFTSVLKVPGSTTGKIKCVRSKDVTIPDEFALDESTLNTFLLTLSAPPLQTYWECKINGSGGSFTRKLEFASNGTGSVDGVPMQWIITQDEYIRYISTAAPIDTIMIELIVVEPSPEGGNGSYFSASHYRINDDEVSGTVECFGRTNIPEADPEPFPDPDMDPETDATLADSLLDPKGLDTTWNCQITGSNSQNHILDFNKDGNGTEDGIAMTWMITPDDYIRYIRADNEFVITIENIELTTSTEPLDDQIYADHYRINDGPDSIQGFVECQRELSGA